MADSKTTPGFLRKLAPVPPTDKHSQRAHEFLTDFIATGEAMQEQRREIEHLQIELEKLHSRNGYAETEMKRIARARDQFQAQYCELKIALEVIVTTAVAACEQSKAATNAAKHACITAAENASSVAETACQSVIDQARATLAQVKNELIRVGVEPPGETTVVETVQDDFEDNLHRIGAAFGANSRKPEESSTK